MLHPATLEDTEPSLPDLLSMASVVFAKNYGTITGKYHVGGTIGNATKNYGKTYAVDYGSIAGTDYVGGAIGRQMYAQYNLVQSTLDGASISGAEFIGGAAGRIRFAQDNLTVRTIVNNSSSVIGSGSLVGGVIGDVRIVENGNGGLIELKGSGSTPVLTVRGVDGVGGAVGGMVGGMMNDAMNSATAPAAPTTPADGMAAFKAKVEKLTVMKEAGMLSDEEFNSMKAKLLSEIL